MIECFDESDETNNNKPKQLTGWCLAATIIMVFLLLGIMWLIYYFSNKIKKLKNELNNDLGACNKSKNDFIKKVSLLNSMIDEYSQKSDSCDNTVKDLQTKLNNFYNEYYRIKGYF